MSGGSQLRVKYDRLKARLTEAKRKTARAKSQYEHAKAHEAGVEAEFEEVRSELDAALDALAAKKAPTASPSQMNREAAPVHVPAYLRELVMAFPYHGPIALDDLKASLGLPTSTVNTRLQKGRKLDLVVRTGRAEYALSEFGQSVRGNRLQAVEGGN